MKKISTTTMTNTNTTTKTINTITTKANKDIANNKDNYYTNDTNQQLQRQRPY